MRQKQFKIGEYAIGGIIEVKITGKIITIRALDYNTKEPLNELGTNGSVMTDEGGVIRKLDNFLNELTSSYYADKIITWIKEKVELEPQRYFSW